MTIYEKLACNIKKTLSTIREMEKSYPDDYDAIDNEIIHDVAECLDTLLELVDE